MKPEWFYCPVCHAKISKYSGRYVKRKIGFGFEDEFLKVCAKVSCQEIAIYGENSKLSLKDSKEKLVWNMV
jgi:hypothetical protein